MYFFHMPYKMKTMMVPQKNKEIQLVNLIHPQEKGRKSMYGQKATSRSLMLGPVIDDGQWRINQKTWDIFRRHHNVRRSMYNSSILGPQTISVSQVLCIHHSLTKSSPVCAAPPPTTLLLRTAIRPSFPPADISSQTPPAACLWVAPRDWSSSYIVWFNIH